MAVDLAIKEHSVVAIAGREPYIFDNSDNVACQYCHDEDAYNDEPLQWSYQFNSCKKMTRLKPGMIICEDLRITTAEKHLWNHFFRCNTTANLILDEGLIHSPQTELKGFCTNSTHTRCIKYFCDTGDQEFIQNYSCVPKCLANQTRDEHTLECVSKDQTVQPLTTKGPGSQQSTKKPTTASPFPTETEPETTAANQKNNGDENLTDNKTLIIIVSALVPLIFGTFVLVLFLYLKRVQRLKERRPSVPEGVALMPRHTSPNTETDTSTNNRPPDRIASTAAETDTSTNNRPPDRIASTAAGERSVPAESENRLAASENNGRPDVTYKDCTFIETYINKGDPPEPTTTKPADITNKTNGKEVYTQPHQESTPSRNKPGNHNFGENVDTNGDEHPIAVSESDERDDEYPVQETEGGLQLFKDKLRLVTDKDQAVETVGEFLETLYPERRFDKFLQVVNYIYKQNCLRDWMEALPVKLCMPQSKQKLYKNIPVGFTAYNSTGHQNSCMYQSVSLQLTGDETLANLLRILAALHGARYVKSFAKQIHTLLHEEYCNKGVAVVDGVRVFYAQHLPSDIMKGLDRITDSKELNFECLKELVMETPLPGNCSSQIQAMFLCGAIGRPIQQYMQKGEEYASFWKNLDPKVFLEDYEPNGEETITIMWVNANDEPNGRINHVVPLWKENEGGVRPITDELLQPDDSSAIRDPQSVSNDRDSSDDSAASIGSQAESITDYADASEGSATNLDPQQDTEQAGQKKSQTTLEVDGEPASMRRGNEMVPSGVLSVGPSQEIVQYADKEWKGDTKKAMLMREAYREIPQHCQCSYLRIIKGDNYCGIRGAVFQLLVNRLPLNPLWSSKEKVLSDLHCAYRTPSTGIGSLSVPSSETYTTDKEVMSQCITSLLAKIEELKDHNYYADHLEIVTRLLNSDRKIDLHLMEGVKLLMLLSAVRLHGDMQQGKDVPEFVGHMFARKTSKALSSFVKNHLNKVGNEGGLEQVEMCLLGYTLGVCIKVFRLQQHGQEDFLSNYPKDCNKDWPTIFLISEDDRHYNVPVQ